MPKQISSCRDSHPYVYIKYCLISASDNTVQKSFNKLEKKKLNLTRTRQLYLFKILIYTNYSKIFFGIYYKCQYFYNLRSICNIHNVMSQTSNVIHCIPFTYFTSNDTTIYMHGWFVCPASTAGFRLVVFFKSTLSKFNE